VDPQYLGIALGRGSGMMDVEFPKQPAEREMLFTGEFLVPKEDHLVTKECLMDFVKRRVI
jgi:hypothetical protein